VLTEDSKIEILQVRRDIISFHGDEAIKQKYLMRVRKHRLANQIVKGVHRWKHEKGSAVGCTLHSYNYWAYEDELGIPNQLACIEDNLFRLLANDQAQLFPEQFLEAIQVGVDPYPAFWKFMLFVLLDAENGLMAISHHEAIHQGADFYRRALEGDEISLDEYLNARQALDHSDTKLVRGLLDALDPLDPLSAFSASDVLETLAERDYVESMHGEYPWEPNYFRERHEAAEIARSAIWRDKLLECLSMAGAASL
jgi:hypothetical protein